MPYDNQQQAYDTVANTSTDEKSQEATIKHEDNKPIFTKAVPGTPWFDAIL